MTGRSVSLGICFFSRKDLCPIAESKLGKKLVQDFVITPCVQCNIYRPGRDPYRQLSLESCISAQCHQSNTVVSALTLKRTMYNPGHNGCSILTFLRWLPSNREIFMDCKAREIIRFPDSSPFWVCTTHVRMQEDRAAFETRIVC